MYFFRHLNRIVLFFILLAMKAAADIPIRLVSHNIRYATTSPFTGEKPWANRRPLLLAELKYNTLYNPESFICLQEVLHAQLMDIMSDLGGEWSYIGVGRDDGKEKGEYSPIIFRKGVWNVDSWETVWLSETPDVPGKGWDAASIRIVTVGTFVHQASKKEVIGMCTHFDDQGVVSRRESAKLILKVVDKVTKPGNSSSSDRLPIFLGGDLNSEPSGEAFQILNARDSLLQDVKELANYKYGDTSTFTGFQDSTRKTLIDHVMVGKDNGNETNWRIKGYAVLENKFEDGVYNSDHRAVVGDVILKI
ncbi:endonuclease/exonuclease/phosphatase family protein-like protein [Periconia macrospinosa]|uniref:Endonuclease/exonuclease/phosphatase family protein-like protein n=1 Tax=Periconia macrospinosa TaxID=97972 RepID=A0A2V1DGR0_9PLEO|nr:endonuclease/exonuclease/phosphatase family protein-like protein [Periconia macrospinosa]